MSTPFPFEEEAQTNQMRGEWNPWKGPAEPHWYSGMGFNDESHYLGPFGRALDAAGAGAAKGEAVLGGLIHQAQQPDSAPSQGFEQPDTKPAFPELGGAIEADAKMRVKAMTPDATTTGSAAQLLHGLVSGFTEMSIGGLAGGVGGAAALVGSAEGTQRYNDLIDAGVDPDTARKSALLSGGAAAAGAIVPAGMGSSLIAKVASGAVGNTLFGVANRYADHKILESAGYPEMAAQQQIIDGTQVLTDLILGAAFGGLAHLHSTPEVAALRNAPGARDAALTTNLAIKDRKSAAGIPADPEAANAHQSAHESSIASLMQGKQVDVSDSGVTEAKFVERPQARNPEIETAVRESIKETGLFGEGNERDIDALLEGRAIEPREPSQARAPAKPIEAAPAEGQPPQLKPEVAETGEPTAEQAPEAETVAKVLDQNPDLTIPDENGQPVSAREALAKAQEEVATTRRESTIAAKAAITCYMRRGN